ncbi:MAG: amidohydrolase family protein [Treponema sp.]|nr:amidohydrolase family protein [Treponema sp.]
MLLIKDATIFTMEDDKVIERGDILIKDGKIAEIGSGLKADNAEIIDAKGLYVVPGLIDAHSHAGGFRRDGGPPDLNESSDPITPQVDAIYAIDIDDPAFKELHEKGVTTVCLIPGSANVICGTGFVTKTKGKNIREMSILNPAVMKCALGGNPKGYGKRDKEPVTRMGVAALFRKALKNAQIYMEKKEKAEGEPPAYDHKHEALIPVLKKEIPLKIHCEQFDMVTAIEIAKEFGCDYTIEHGWACDRFSDELVEGGGAVMFGPIGIPEGSGELTGGDVGFVRELDERGLNVCLITDGPIFGADVLLISAGEAVRYGIPHMRALRMITINAATGLRVGHRVGSLAPGKDADIAIFNGIPALETAAKVIYTIIDGKIVYKNSV